ncbi:hypothetical protein BD626DRAFT_393169, partial [Schizophyllum amplum]
LPTELVRMVACTCDGDALRALSQSSSYLQAVAYPVLHHYFTIQSAQDVTFLLCNSRVHMLVRSLTITLSDAPIELPRLPNVTTLHWTCENKDPRLQADAIEIAMVLSLLPALRSVTLRVDVERLTDMHLGIMFAADAIETLDIAFPSVAPQYTHCSRPTDFSRLRRLHLSACKDSDITPYIRECIAPYAPHLEYVSFASSCEWVTFCTALDCLPRTIQEIEISDFVGMDAYDDNRYEELSCLSTIVLDVRRIKTDIDVAWDALTTFTTIFAASRLLPVLHTVRIRLDASVFVEAFLQGREDWYIFDSQHGGESPIQWDVWLPNAMVRGSRMEFELSSVERLDSDDYYMLRFAMSAALSSLGDHRVAFVIL